MYISIKVRWVCLFFIVTIIILPQTTDASSLSGATGDVMLCESLKDENLNVKAACNQFIENNPDKYKKVELHKGGGLSGKFMINQPDTVHIVTNNLILNKGIKIRENNIAIIGVGNPKISISPFSNGYYEPLVDSTGVGLTIQGLQFAPNPHVPRLVEHVIKISGGSAKIIGVTIEGVDAVRKALIYAENISMGGLLLEGVEIRSGTGYFYNSVLKTVKVDSVSVKDIIVHELNQDCTLFAHEDARLLSFDRIRAYVNNDRYKLVVGIAAIYTLPSKDVQISLNDVGIKFSAPDGLPVMVAAKDEISGLIDLKSGNSFESSDISNAAGLAINDVESTEQPTTKGMTAVIELPIDWSAQSPYCISEIIPPVFKTHDHEQEGVFTEATVVISVLFASYITSVLVAMRVCLKGYKDACTVGNLLLLDVPNMIESGWYTRGNKKRALPLF